MPHSNHITLRVSSDTNPDISADTLGSLRVNTWSHVAFSFENITGGSFVARVFINGTLDISVDYGSNILANPGPLHIGRDPSNLGPRSLVSMARLWQETLSQEQVGVVYRESKPLFAGEASHALASRFPAIHAVESMWTRRHSTRYGQRPEFERASCTHKKYALKYRLHPTVSLRSKH